MHLLLPLFLSLTVAEEAAFYLGTDEKHFHYECMGFIKRREVQAPTAQLPLGRQNHVLRQSRDPSAQAITDSHL